MAVRHAFTIVETHRIHIVPLAIDRYLVVCTADTYREDFRTEMEAIAAADLHYEQH
jgi:hypothetical protein